MNTTINQIMTQWGNLRDNNPTELLTNLELRFRQYLDGMKRDGQVDGYMFDMDAVEPLILEVVVDGQETKLELE